MNVKLADGVRHLYISGLNSTSITSDYGLRYWLLISNNFLVEPKSEDVFAVSYYDKTDLLKTIAFDVNRLSTAAFETVINNGSQAINKKFLAWKLIGYYYSAFYSAHSILKILGFGLVQLDDKIISRLKKRAQDFGYSVSIHKGIYCVDFVDATGQAIFYKVGRYDDSHKGLWHRFVDVLNVISGKSVRTGDYDSNCIIARPQSSPYPDSIFTNLTLNDAISLLERIDELKAVLNTRGNNNWLSSIRNSINYNHEYGVWFPFKGYVAPYHNIGTYDKLCFQSPTDSCFDKCDEEDLNKFVRYCQLVNAINYEILNDLLSRHPENKSFLKQGFNAYVQLHMNNIP